MATNDADTNDTKVREVLAVAKELHAAQQQSMRLLARYKTLLGKLPGELWTDKGILHVVDADRTVWRMMWNGGYPSVERVAAVDVLDEPNEKLPPAFPKVVYTENGTGIMLPAMWGEATEGRPAAPDDDAPAMWKEAQGL